MIRRCKRCESICPDYSDLCSTCTYIELHSKDDDELADVVDDEDNDEIF